MSYTPPSPPEPIPEDLAAAVEDQPPEVLRDLARYTEALAEYREREARLEDAEDAEDADPQEDRPAEVPSKATVTVKEINDNRYYYWQWREGEKVRSKYKGPVDPNE